MTTYLEDMKARICAMQIEACASVIVVDSVPIWLHNQSTFPYWKNRVSSAAYSDYLGASQESLRAYTITMRLVIGHLTAGYAGQSDILIDQLEPAIVDFFYKRPLLTCTAYTTPMRYLSPETAQITASPNGVASFQTHVEGVNDIGMEWILSAAVVLSKDFIANG